LDEPSRIGGRTSPSPAPVQFALLRIFRINVSNMSNCDQTAAGRFGILPFTFAVCLRPEEMTS